MNININRTNILRSLVLIMGGIIIGALLFGFGGNNSEQQEHTEEETHEHDEQGEESTVWTCSMHPQIREDEPGDCPICGMELIPADEEDQDQKDPQKITLTERAAKLAEIQTSKVVRSLPEKELSLTGKIQVDERLVNSQSVHFPGRIEKLYLNFKGESVRKGQNIAKIYSPALISAQEELLEAIKNRSPESDMVEAAKEKLRQWKLSEQQIEDIIDEGQVREEMTVQADTDGIVYEKLVNKGDYIKKGDVLYNIARVDRVWVMFDAYQEDIQFISEGDEISFEVSSVPGKTFESTVKFIDPVMDSKSRVARIRAEADNKNGSLKPGMFADGTLYSRLDGVENERITIPRSAVMWTGKRSVVYRKVDNQGVSGYKLQEVVLGPSLGDTYVIEQGLDEGDEVVTYGTFAVDAAAQLAGKPSMMNKDGEKQQTGHDHGEMSDSENMEEVSSSSDAETEALEWPSSEMNNYERLIDEYLELKNMLVKGEKVDGQARSILSVLVEIDMGAFSHEAHEEWMEYQKVIKEKSQAILDVDKIEKQRKHFIKLSDAMIDLLESFKAPGEELYVQFCPMANDDEGAFWLSDENQIRNPYFGDQMLTCGEVREEIE